MKKWLLVVLGVLAGLVLLAVVVLFLLGFRGDANRVEHTVEIGRPAAAVWPWVVEPEKQLRWVSWLTEVHPSEPGPPRPGHRVTWVLIDPTMGDQRVEVHAEYVELEPARRAVLALESAGMFRGTATYELTDLGDGTSRLRYASDYRFDSWLARLFEPLVTPQARKKAIEDVGRLKELVEAEGAAGMAV